MKRCSIALAVALCIVASAPVFSQKVEPRPESGRLQLTTTEKRVEVKVNVTDANAKIIPTERFPRTFEFGTDTENSLRIPIPEKVNRSDNQQIEFIKDVSYTMTVPNKGMQADVMIESLFFDSGTNQYRIASIFGTIADRVGFEQEISLPNLFADTNGDGTLGTGDILYSLVDLGEYLNAPPSFSLGDTFTIANGEVVGLPGMRFSTTPFSFDPASGFSGTPFTGTGQTDVRASAAALPEPGSLALVGGGILGLLGGARRRSGRYRI